VCWTGAWGGKTFEFGISGLLFHSNVLLYDRTDHALWSQVGLKAVSGPHHGQSLKHLAGWSLTTFETWKRKFPESTVLTFETGYRRRYQTNPYQGYFQTDRLMFPVPKPPAGLANKSPVIGLKLASKTKAYPLDEIIKSPPWSNG